MIHAGTVQAAANLRAGGGEPLTMTDFLDVFPQFAPPTVSAVFLEMMLAQANAAISEARWHSRRAYAICLFVAHHTTLWLRTSAGAEDKSPTAIAGMGNSRQATSKSVGGVSVSYGSAEGTSDLAGYGAWKETEYGIQLATMAKTVGKGMMLVL